MTASKPSPSIHEITASARDAQEATTAALAEQLLRAQEAEHRAVEAAHKMADDVLSLYEKLKVKRNEIPSHDPRLPLYDEVIAELAAIVGLLPVEDETEQSIQ